jgi:hypothetical protein
VSLAGNDYPVRYRRCECVKARCIAALGCDSGAISRSKYSFLSGAESLAKAGNRIDEGLCRWQFLHERPLRERQDAPVLRAVSRNNDCRQDSLSRSHYQRAFGRIEEDGVKQRFRLAGDGSGLFAGAVPSFLGRYRQTEAHRFQNRGSIRAGGWAVSPQARTDGNGQLLIAGFGGARTDASGNRPPLVLTKDWYHKQDDVLTRLEKLLQGKEIETEIEPPEEKVVERISTPQVDGKWDSPVAPPATASTTMPEPPPIIAPVTLIRAPSRLSSVHHFEFVGGSSKKFWEISIAGNSFTVRFGRIGTAGQSQTKTFAISQAEAIQDFLYCRRRIDRTFKACSFARIRIQVFFHLLSFVRLVHWYYGAVRRLRPVRACRTALAFTSRSAPLPRADSSEVSRFSCMKFPGVPGVLDYVGLVLAIAHAWMLPSPCVHRVGTPNSFFEAQYPAHRCLCLRFACCLTSAYAKLEVGMVRYSFPVRLFHSLLHTGLSRRTDTHCLNKKTMGVQVFQVFPGKPRLLY